MGGRESLFSFRRIGGESNYGHHFGWGKLRVTVYGSGTYHLALTHLPFKNLPWRLLDAGPHFGRSHA